MHDTLAILTDEGQSGGGVGRLKLERPVCDEEQHVQPPQLDRDDGEEVAGDDPGGLLAKERPPGRARSSRGGIEPVAAQGRADRGGRDPHAEPSSSPWMRW
jgi:hypothetical protein